MHALTLHLQRRAKRKRTKVARARHAQHLGITQVTVLRRPTRSTESVSAQPMSVLDTHKTNAARGCMKQNLLASADATAAVPGLVYGHPDGWQGADALKRQ